MARDPLLRALVVVGLASCVWFPLGPGSIGLRVISYWFIQVVLNVVFVAVSLRLIRLPTLNPAVRRFWRAVAFSGVVFAVADAAQMTVAIAHPDYGSVSDAAVPTVILMLGVACALWAMLEYPIQARGRERLKWWLDAATILAAAAGFLWALLWTGARAPTSLGAVTLAAGLTLVSAFGLLKLLLGGNAPFPRPAGLAAAAAGAMVGLDTAFASAPAGPVVTNLLMAARVIASLLLAASPRIQLLQLRADPDVLFRPRRGRYSRLPYVALAAAQLLLILVLLTDGLGGRAWGVLAAAIAATAVVVVRQLVAFSDNARLLTSLDETTLNARRQEDRFRSLVQHAWDLTLIADREGRITYASPATDRILGVPPDEVMDLRYSRLIRPDDAPIVARTIANLIRTPNKTLTTNLRARHVDGSWRWLEIVSTNLLADPSVSGVIHNVRDVTETHHYQERLRHEATHDSLTRLGNRAMFDERAHDRDDPPDHRIGILSIDLDNFKVVNDTLGHHVGDGLLAAVAGRLAGCVRPVDTLARIGGDEFAILLPGASAADAARVAARILRALDQPVYVDGHPLPAHASIGVAVGSRGDIDDLLHASDAAMYEAKKSGKNAYLAADLSRPATVPTPVPTE